MEELKSARQVLLERQKSRERLIPFIQYTMPNYNPSKLHHLIAKKLEAIADGKIERLMIFVPPRHGKSTLSSRYFPAWYLGKYPDRQIISASYNYDYASEIGRDVRNIVDSAEYRTLFSTRLAADSQAAGRWHTNQNGVYIAAGIGTAITGRGAHIAIIDDPHKDREEADSKIMQDKVYAWYKSVLYTRLMPGASIVLIQTRWSEEDLAGKLLKDMEAGEGDQWEIINLPAIATENDVLGRKPGDALWPEFFPIKELERRRLVVSERGGAREWSALYQQDPLPESGNFFTKDMIRLYSAHQLPEVETLRIYGASDYAVSNVGDYTVHGIIGVDRSDNIYVLDWWRKQSKPDLWIEVLLDMVLKWKPAAWIEESGQIKRAIGPFLEKRMQERQIYFRRIQIAHNIGDKEEKARSIQARMSAGKIFFPRGIFEDKEQRLWMFDLEREILKFPAGRHDDQVDVLSLFGRMLNEMRPKSLDIKPNVNSSWTFKYLMDRGRKTRSGIITRKEAQVTKTFTLDELFLKKIAEG